MDQDQDKIVFYKNTITTDENSVAVYTETQEDFAKLAEELASIVIFKSARYFLLGTLIGLFGGFSIAKGSELEVKAELIRQNVTRAQLTALLAIARVESDFRPNAIGKAKEQGLWQLHPKYFKLHDFSIKTQVKAAVKHYKYLTKTCPDVSVALAWNLGCGGARKIKNPKQFGYYKKFKKELSKQYEASSAGSKTFQVSDTW